MGGDTVIENVTSAVADEKGVSEAALPPLYWSIDPDALEELFSHPNTTRDTELLVQFSYAECKITVSQEGKVSVE